MILKECEKKEWTVVSRGSIKRFLVETVAYVFTDILLLFGQSQPFLFQKSGLQMLKEKHSKWYLNMEELRYKAGLSVALSGLVLICNFFEET